MQTETLHAPTIHCGHCVAAIKRAVGKLPGVSSVEGDATSRNVTVTFHPAQVDLNRIQQTMADEGYPVA